MIPHDDCRLAHDTALYKEAVGTLKEVKPQIESLQAALAKSQARSRREISAASQRCDVSRRDLGGISQEDLESDYRLWVTRGGGADAARGRRAACGGTLGGNPGIHSEGYAENKENGPPRPPSTSRRDARVYAHRQPKELAMARPAMAAPQTGR